MSIESRNKPPFPDGENQGQSLEPALPMELFQDRLLVPAFTIDASSTLQRDDGLGYEVTPEGENVYIHVSDIPSLIDYTNPRLREKAMEQIHTNYSRNMRLFPEEISKQLGSFNMNTHKLALTWKFNVASDLSLVNPTPLLTQIVPSINLSFENADQELKEGKSQVLWRLYEIAYREYEKRKLHQGPDENLKEIEGIVFAYTNKKYHLSSFIVYEYMLLFNRMSAAWLKERGVSLIYRNYNRSKEDFKTVKHSTSPEGHDGFGLEYYARFSSPIYRGPDFINITQLSSVLKTGKPALRNKNISALVRNMEKHWSEKHSGTESVREIPSEKLQFAKEQINRPGIDLSSINKDQFNLIVRVASEEDIMTEDLENEIYERIVNNTLTFKDYFYLTYFAFRRGDKWQRIQTTALEVIDNNPTLARYIIRKSDDKIRTKSTYNNERLGENFSTKLIVHHPVYGRIVSKTYISEDLYTAQGQAASEVWNNILFQEEHVSNSKKYKKNKH